MQSAEGIKGVRALLNGCEKNISRALEGLLFFLNEWHYLDLTVTLLSLPILCYIKLHFLTCLSMQIEKEEHLSMHASFHLFKDVNKFLSSDENATYM